MSVQLLVEHQKRHCEEDEVAPAKQSSVGFTLALLSTLDVFHSLPTLALDGMRPTV